MMATSFSRVRWAVLSAVFMVHLGAAGAPASGGALPRPGVLLAQAGAGVRLGPAEFSALKETLQGLRRALADQEERLERSRKAIQDLTDRLEKERQASEESWKKASELIEALKARIESLENEVVALRSSEPKEGEPGRAAAPVGRPARAAPVGVPQTAEAAVGVPRGAGGVAAGMAAVGSAGPVAAPQGPPVAGGVSGPISRPPAPSALAKTTEPEAEFNEALRVLKEERSFPRARALLGAFIEKYPTHELADDAQYWIGQTYFEEKNFERAILAFNKVQVDYANGDKAPGALLQEALSFLSLGDRASARELLGRVVGKYPGTEAAETARERLKSL